MTKADTTTKARQLALRVERAFQAGDTRTASKLLIEFRRLGLPLPSPYCAAIDAYVRKGDRQAVEDVLKEATRAGLSAGQLAYLNAKSAMAMGDHTVALEELRRAHLLEPEDSNILRELAAMLGTQGDYADCIQLYHQLLTKPEPQSRDFSNLARALASTDDIAGCKQAIEQALRLDPNSLHAYTVLAWAHQRTGQLDEAELALVQVSGRSPGI